MEKRKVAIILFVDKDRILLQDRRKMSKHGEEYGFFDGKIKDNETSEQALKREIKEELGINMKEFKLFKSYHQIIKEIDRDVVRNVFLSPMPKIDDLKVKEGELALMSFEDSFKLKMIPGGIDLLKEIHQSLKKV